MMLSTLIQLASSAKCKEIVMNVTVGECTAAIAVSKREFVLMIKSGFDEHGDHETNYDHTVIGNQSYTLALYMNHRFGVIKIAA